MTVFGFIGFALILDKFAFNFLFLRMWQFSSGFIVLFWTKIRSRKPPNKNDSEKDISTISIPIKDFVVVALSILGLSLLPKEINVLVLRPLVTLATAFIIGAESKNVQVCSGIRPIKKNIF